MDSYNFTYKDVLKRYERIINKPSKFEIRLLASILLIITIVNITSLCFASSDVSYEQVGIYGLLIEGDNVTLKSEGATRVFHINTESNKSYKFFVENNNNQGTLSIKIINFGNVDSIDVNSTGVIQNSVNILPGDSATFSFNSGDSVYMAFSTAGVPIADYIDSISITSSGYDNSISGLVDNVGISQIWDIFDTSIGFVGVVVLAAFGIFLVVIAIRKMQKGKSDF